MSVYREKGHKTWRMDFIFAGQRIKDSTGTRSKTLAREMERKRRRELEEGVAGIRKRQTPRLLSVAAEEWLTMRRPTIAASTAGIYECALGHLLPVLGGRLLQDLDGQDVARYQQQRQAAGASGRTVNMEVGALRQIMRRYRLWGNVQPDVKMLPESASPGVAITREQETRLLEECAASRARALYTFVVLAIETGARYNVIRTLQWKRVDFAGRCLQWGKDKTPTGTGRMVPLSQRAAMVLEQWAAGFHERKPEHFVFPSERYGGAGREGQQGSRKDAAFAGAKVYGTDPTRPLGDFKEAWEAARKRAGLSLRMHDCRHLAASRMLDAGVALPKVAKILGWAPSTMAHMAARYGHFRLEELRDAVETISAPESKTGAGSPAKSPTVGAPDPLPVA